MRYQEIIFIKEGYSLEFAGHTYKAGDTFNAPHDLAVILIREGKALLYREHKTPEPKHNA